MKEYKICKELNQLTPQIIRAWNDECYGDVYIVRKQILLRCPKTNELVPESECLSCTHYFGWGSDGWIYCVPNTDREIGVRSRRKKNGK